MITAPIPHQTLLTELSCAIRHVQKNGGWLVLLCPSYGVALQAGKALAAMVPSGTLFSGRTALFPGGKITVVDAQQEPWINDPFWLRFLGWAETSDMQGVQAWRSKAAGVIQLQ